MGCAGRRRGTGKCGRAAFGVPMPTWSCTTTPTDSTLGGGVRGAAVGRTGTATPACTSGRTGGGGGTWLGRTRGTATGGGVPNGREGRVEPSGGVTSEESGREGRLAPPVIVAGGGGGGRDGRGETAAGGGGGGRVTTGGSGSKITSGMSGSDGRGGRTPPSSVGYSPLPLMA